MTTAISAAPFAVVLGIYLAAVSPARSQVLVPVRGTFGVHSIVAIGDEVWLAGSNGVFHVDRTGNQAMHLTGVNGEVHSIVPVGNEVWLADSRGALRLDRTGSQAVRVQNVTGVVAIVAVRDEVWLGTINGVFRANQNGNHVERLGGVTGAVNTILPVGDEVWLGGTEGAYKVAWKGNQALRLGGVKGRVDSMVTAGNDIWLVATGIVFRVDRKSNQAVRLTGVTGRVYSILPVGDELWLGGTEGAFRVDGKGKHAVRLEGVAGQVSAIVQIGDEVWLEGSGSVFRVERKGNRTVRLGGVTGVISIVPVGGLVWLGGTDGVFQVDRKDFQAVRFGGIAGRPFFVVPIGDQVWFWNEFDVFREDQHARISIELDGIIPGVMRLLGVAVWFEGASRPIIRYLDTQTGKERYSSSQAAPIALVFDSDLKKLRDKEEDQRNWTILSQDGPLIELKPGWRRINIAVQDSWGNQPQVQIVEGLVIPPWALSVLIPALGICFCLVCLALAPYVRYCHMLLMNPFLRNWVSFGVVPLLVTAVRPLRRHILRRYCRTLARQPRFQSFTNRYVVPDARFTSPEFGKMLSEHKVVGLHGQSGIGKSAFLAYLVDQCVSQGAVYPLFRCVVPVFLDLSIADGVTPGEMVRTVMRKYGDLTDEKLIEVMLDYGGFLFLFDGLNEVNEQTSLIILQFADMHRNHSYSCLTTQVASEELRGVSTLVLSGPISDDKIRELVRRMAIDAKTQRQKFDPELLLEKFTLEIYRICRVPMQLELTVEMWEASGMLPTNLDGLYAYVLGPLMDKEAWSNQGHGDWPDLLSALAFTMMTAKRPYDPEKDYLPGEVKADLLKAKLLVERGDVLEFRHDRVRAYLAARYFALRWRTILTDEKTTVDPNWDTMLEFHLAVEQNKDQTRDLVFAIINKDMDAAVRLISWGRRNRPELFKDWQDEFAREIGKRVMSRSQKLPASLDDR